MIIDQVLVTAAASTLPLPTATSTATPTSVAPIPSIVPDKPEFQVSTETGVRTFWVVFIIFAISSAIFAGLSWKIPVQKRVFHVITTLALVFGALSYFAFATGHGSVLHHTVGRSSHKHVPDTKHDVYREVFFARYIEWALTTPLLLLDLAILAGLSGVHIIIIIVADLIVVLTGLFVAFGHAHSPQKWGWYAIGIIGYFVVLWHLVYHGRNTAIRRGSSVSNFYTAILGFTIIVWTIYPIIWGVAAGARKLSVDKEIITYAVLDILAKPVFGTWLLVTLSKIPETQVGLGGFWSYGFNPEGQLRLEDDEGA